MADRPTHRFLGRLQWKRVLSYTAATALAFFIVIVLALLIAVFSQTGG